MRRETVAQLDGVLHRAERARLHGPAGRRGADGRRSRFPLRRGVLRSRGGRLVASGPDPEVFPERHDAERDGDDAVAHGSDLGGGGLREVDDPPRDERPAVVHLDAHGLPVLLVRDLDEGAERQRAVRGGDLLGPERLAGSGGQAVELLPVPRRQPALDGCRGSGSGKAARTSSPKESTNTRQGETEDEEGDFFEVKRDGRRGGATRVGPHRGPGRIHFEEDPRAGCIPPWAAVALRACCRPIHLLRRSSLPLLFSLSSNPNFLVRLSGGRLRVASRGSARSRSRGTRPPARARGR